MQPRSGEELAELEARQEPRLVKALEMVAPGTALREGIDNIVHARTGGLITIGDPDELSFMFSGGIRLDIDYTPALITPGGIPPFSGQGQPGPGPRTTAPAPAWTRSPPASPPSSSRAVPRC